MRDNLDVVHRWEIDQDQYARHEARRGRRHAYERLNPPSTALVVIDMIPFFVDANPYAHGVVPNINSLAGVLRAEGGAVAWIVPATVQPSPTRVEFLGPAVAETYRTAGGDVALSDRLWPELVTEPDDLVLPKSSPGAFFPGHCVLHEQLLDRAIDTVIVAGTVADVCCESTVREASTLGYRVIMVADGNAAGCDRDLNATLKTVYRSFGDVRSTNEIIDMLRAPPSVSTR